jgi:hypothetical protein
VDFKKILHDTADYIHPSLDRNYWRCRVNVMMNVGSEVLTTVVMKSTSMTASDKQSNMLTTCIDIGQLFDLFFDPEDGRHMFLRNVG